VSLPKVESSKNKLKLKKDNRIDENSEKQHSATEIKQEIKGLVEKLLKMKGKLNQHLKDGGMLAINIKNK
jgi:hypothetical protein